MALNPSKTCIFLVCLKVVDIGPSEPQVRISCSILGHLGVILGSLGALLGPSWALLGPSWALLGPSWALLGPSWGPLGPHFSHLGAILPHLVVYLVHLGPSHAHLSRTQLISAQLSPSWSRLGLMWTPSDAPEPIKNTYFLYVLHGFYVGPSLPEFHKSCSILGHLVVILGSLGALLGPSWALLWPSWALVGPSWVPLGPPGVI